MLSALLSVCLVLSASAGDGPKVAAAALESVFEAPRPWLERELRVTFQLRALPEQWNPYMTRFGTRDYVAAEVWGDGQYLWRERDFGRPLGLIFAPRRGAVAEQLAAASPYQRFSARVRVRQVFLGRPWAEILELIPERRAVSEGTILHASRALQLMAGGDWQLARDDLLRAAAALLPAHAQEELDRLIAVCDEALAARASRRIPVRRGN